MPVKVQSRIAVREDVAVGVLPLSGSLITPLFPVFYLAGNLITDTITTLGVQRVFLVHDNARSTARRLTKLVPECLRCRMFARVEELLDTTHLESVLFVALVVGFWVVLLKSSEPQQL